jgi:polyisoprenoid-binding protein YceI
VAVSRVAAAATVSLGVALSLALACLAPARAADIDPEHSRIGFLLKTRWGQALEGRFPVFRGEVESLAEGRRRVRLVLSAREVEIVDHPAYTRITRGRGFFDAERFPDVAFVSRPYAEPLTREGGRMVGTLTIRGVSRQETFHIAPSACARPGLDCDVVASGDVRRSDYGMGRWGIALADEVRFSLRIRTRESAP